MLSVSTVSPGGGAPSRAAIAGPMASTAPAPLPAGNSRAIGGYPKLAWSMPASFSTIHGSR